MGKKQTFSIYLATSTILISQGSYLQHVLPPNSDQILPLGVCELYMCFAPSKFTTVPSVVLISSLAFVMLH